MDDTEHGSAVATMAAPREIYAAAVDAPAESPEVKATRRALASEQARFERRMCGYTDGNSARSMNGVGGKANPRRNGRLMGGTLTDRDFTGRPTAPVETVRSAAGRWLTPRTDDGVRHKPGKRAQVYRRTR